MSLAQQFTIQMENRRGSLASLCTELAKVAVNINAIQVPDHRGLSSIRVVAHPPETAKKILEKMGWSYREETVLAAHLPHRPGALGKITRKLADRGIDILYAYGSLGPRNPPAHALASVAGVHD